MNPTIPQESAKPLHWNLDLNSFVGVKLNALGVGILKDSMLHENTAVDDEGYSTIRILDLLRVFGPACEDCMLPFDRTLSVPALALSFKADENPSRVEGFIDFVFESGNRLTLPCDAIREVRTDTIAVTVRTDTAEFRIWPDFAFPVDLNESEATYSAIIGRLRGVVIPEIQGPLLFETMEDYDLPRMVRQQALNEWRSLESQSKPIRCNRLETL